MANLHPSKYATVKVCDPSWIFVLGNLVQMLTFEDDLRTHLARYGIRRNTAAAIVAAAAAAATAKRRRILLVVCSEGGGA